MCGILGLLGDYDEVSNADFDIALDTLQHRGPDDRGVYIDNHIMLGHRRLSIIDLSSSGHQPMVSDGAVIVFNGEIYNYLEIKEELVSLGRVFYGDSDTEVLLKSILEWGSEALTRLNGMWSFALWQPDKRELFIARDRFGVKPLYYCHHSKGIAFASEPKALLSLFPEYRKVNEETLLDFLGNNLLYAREESFYQGIHVLPPAHYCIFSLDKLDTRPVRYWSYPDSADCNLTGSEAISRFDQIFSESVRLRLRSDIEIGVTLSGGLDSTGVLAATNSCSNDPLVCFTSTYKGSKQGEYSWAKVASHAVGSTLIQSESSKEDWLGTMKSIAYHMDGPGYSPAVYPLWNLMQKAKSKNIHVLLEGQGADEALAGYPQYLALQTLNELLNFKNIFATLLRIGRMRHTFPMRWIFAWFARGIFPKLLQWHRKRVGFQSLMHKHVKIPDLPDKLKYQRKIPVRQQLINDHSLSILPGLLHYGDAISMAHSVESRNPFLDYRLVEWMFKLPPHIIFNNNESKWVLREYLRRHNQKSIGNRKDKQGYPTPVGDWIKKEYRKEIELLLLKEDSMLHKWCDPLKIKKLIKESEKEAMSADFHLYKLISTQVWLNECIE